MTAQAEPVRSAGSAGVRRRCAVLGHPIEHSLSPTLHRAAYEALGLDWAYTAQDVTQDGLRNFLATCDSSWVGVSLTMPLKVEVLAHLATATPDVSLARAANTVLFDGGALHGHNTDITGMVSALRERGIEQLGLATIVGTGATARSAMVALARLGASAVHVVGRSPDGRHDLVALGGEQGVQVIETELAGPEVEGALAADVVVTTIPSAAAAALTTHLPAAKHGVLFDVLYDPWPTPIAQAWQGPVLGGLDLLVHQAIGQLELMTGRTVPVDVLRRAGVAALAARASAVRPLD